MEGSYIMGRTGKSMVVLLLAVALFAVPLFAATGHGAEAGVENGGEGWNAKSEIPRIVNFVVIVVLLWFFLRKPLARYFANRREGIQKLLEEAVRARDEAEAKVEEYREKMRNLEQEVAALQSEAEGERENLRQSLLEEARKSADRVIEQARVNIDLERKRATDSLKTEASLLALELAEDLLKENISPEDRERINRECIEGLKEE
jgi:F-type H+-transporting ATPase subunit b